MPILVTGAAGFIGFHVCKKLLETDESVIGLDNLNPYYDPNLKVARINELKKIDLNNQFTFIKGNLEDKEKIYSIFDEFKPSRVVNLAAQAGVRYSIDNPSAYIQANLVGFGNILEACREYKVEHLIYASSSSVYGGNTNMPFSESHNVDHPVSLYAASKKANELMAHTYSHLYNLPCTGLRFFTVYGPWGRPDMALFKFTKSIIENNPIDVFNNGDMIRDFTYIDDICESITRVIYKNATPNERFNKKDPNPNSSWAPYRIFNIGNSCPTPLMEYISAIEEAIGGKAKINFLPMQMGDVKSTSADTSALEEWVKFKPNTSIKEGILKFVDWYKIFYKI